MMRTNIMRSDSTQSPFRVVQRQDEQPPLVEATGVYLAYNGQPVLQDIHLTVHCGEFVSIIGPSGCGKSSLLNLIAGFIMPTAGTLCVHGEPVRGPGPDRGVVFQDLALFPWLNVIENVAFGLKMQGVPRAERLRQAQETLRLVGLAGKEHARIADLSGGMKQRVAIARTLVVRPDILLMDEPFSALDAQTRDNLQDELMRIHAETQATVVFITHSIDEAVYLSDRVVVLSPGPGRVLDDIRITAPRPREESWRTTAEFNAYKATLMEYLRKNPHTTEVEAK